MTASLDIIFATIVTRLTEAHASNDVDDLQSEGDRNARSATASESNRLDCDPGNVDGGVGYGRDLEKLAGAVIARKMS